MNFDKLLKEVYKQQLTEEELNKCLEIIENIKNLKKPMIDFITNELIDSYKEDQ